MRDRTVSPVGHSCVSVSRERNDTSRAANASWPISPSASLRGRPGHRLLGLTLIAVMLGADAVGLLLLACATTLLGNIAYSGVGGVAGQATSADVAGGTYSYSANYDANVRLSSLSISNVSTSTMLFRSQRGYDAVGNVTAVNTTLADGTDNQAFCYDEQKRLTWAGSGGTPSCGASLTAGSLTGANYTQTFGYDTLDRLTSGPLGSYTYGDTTHLHAATSIGSTTCRAPTSATTCSGTPTGAVFGYDNEGRLATWQNAPSSPTMTDAFLSDGEDNRVTQQVTVGGPITATTTYVAGGLE